jgi:hypothetical protein
MTAAALGFLGVVVGLAVGFGYRFWAARRAETAHAMVASAVLAEELRALQASQTTGPSHQDERVQAAWREHRRWLIPRMSPADIDTVALSISPLPGEPPPFDTGRAERLGVR